MVVVVLHAGQLLAELRHVMIVHQRDRAHHRAVGDSQAFCTSSVRGSGRGRPQNGVVYPRFPIRRSNLSSSSASMATPMGSVSLHGYYYSRVGTARCRRWHELRHRATVGTIVHIRRIPVDAGVAGLDLAAVPAVGYLARRASQGFAETRAPLLGVMGAFVFRRQMVNFPVGVGTSGHLVGGALLALHAGSAAAAVV